MKTTLALVASIALTTLPSAALAQEENTPSTECANCINAEDARADLSTLLSRMESEHVDLYARVSKAEYEAKIASLLSRIDGPVAPTDFNLLVQEALAFGQIGHFKTDALFQSVMGYIGEGGTIIPLSVTWRGDSLLTEQWALAEGRQLPPGSRIIGLGGLTLAEFVERARPMIPADTERLLRSQMELALPAYLYLVFGPVKNLEIAYETPAGVATSVSVPAIGFGEMYALQDARPVSRGMAPSSARLHRDLGDGVYYIKPGPFFLNEDEKGPDGETYDIAPFDAFVRKAFAGLQQSGASDLILDLRNNPGGDVSFSDLIVARLTDEPYRMAARYTVRAGSNTKAGWADWKGEPGTLASKVAEGLNTTATGDVFEVDVPQIMPIADLAFDGRVVALVDRHSYSNAVVTAALLQDLGIATIMGTETADLPTTFAAVETLSLERTGVSVTYPKALMVRHSASDPLSGVVPDFAIAENPVGSERDTMLDIAKTQVLLSR